MLVGYYTAIAEAFANSMAAAGQWCSTVYHNLTHDPIYMIIAGVIVALMIVLAIVKRRVSD
jgi:hypothetical protein